MEVLSNIGFDWQVALANFVSFVIIFLILKKWVFGPVASLLEERRQVIQEGIDTTERSREELKEAQHKADATVKDAKQHANEIVAKAKLHGDELISQAIEQAETEAAGVITKARESIEKEKKQAEQEVHEHAAHLVSLGVQKILEEEVDVSRNTSLTKKAVDALKSVSR